MLIPFGILSSAGAGGAVAGDYELIETKVLGTAVSTVTFSSLATYASTYRHLQIRTAARTAQASGVSELAVRVNGVTSSSYSWHILRGGTDMSVSSAAGSTQTAMFLSLLAASSSASNNFNIGVIDILDAYSTTKNKTFRGFSGVRDPNTSRAAIYSGLFQSTDSISSISLLSQDLSSNLVVGSRFSLYGIRG